MDTKPKLSAEAYKARNGKKIVDISYMEMMPYPYVVKFEDGYSGGYRSVFTTPIGAQPHPYDLVPITQGEDNAN